MSGVRERIYRFVRDRILEGSPPTVREVQQAAGLRAVESARQHLEGLVKEGRLIKKPGRARGYFLPPGAIGPLVRVPLVGRVQAGVLTTAVEEPEGYVPVETRYPVEELFALRVRGESMVGAGILPGDVVVVHRQPVAEDGEIVVALVDDEATVKRLRFRHRRVELHAEHPAFEPIVPPRGELRLLGRVIEVRRFLDR